VNGEVSKRAFFRQMKMKQLNFNYRAVDGIPFFLRSTEPSPNLQPPTSTSACTRLIRLQQC
jgi:hypothetical protein